MSYNPTDRPTAAQLSKELKSITDWQSLALHLPGIQIHHRDTIEANYPNDVKRQQTALFEKWLDIQESATWKDIRTALRDTEHNSLAVELVNDGDICTGSHLNIQEGNRCQAIYLQEQTTVETTLMELNTMFLDVITDVKTYFIKIIAQNPNGLQEIISYAEEAIKHPSRIEASNIQDFFRNIRPYYDFIDCQLIVCLAQRFIERDDELLTKLRRHSAKAREFCRTTPIKQLTKDLIQIHSNFSHLPTLPKIHIKLNSPWENIVTTCLFTLIQFLLPRAAQSQYSPLLTNIIILPGSLSLFYSITHPSLIHTILQHLLQNLNSLKLIGIFQLMVNYIYLIAENEDPNFSFNAALHDAITKDNNNAVKFLLLIGTDVNCNGIDGLNTGLTLACQLGHHDIVQTLLSANADVNSQLYDGKTALMVACLKGSNDIVKTLLSANADVNSQCNDEMTALMLACYLGHRDIVQTLISANADVNSQCDDGATALLLACSVGHHASVQLLLSANADVNCQYVIDGVPPLTLACRYGHHDIVQALLSANANVNHQCYKGRTALMAACLNGHHEIVQTLLSADADVNCQMDNGSTALLLCMGGHSAGIYDDLLTRDRIFNQLLSKNADPSLAVDTSGLTFSVLDCCIMGEELTNVELLLTECEIPLATITKGLYVALLNGNTKIISVIFKTLLSKTEGINPLLAPLAASCVEGDTETVTSLMEQGVHPDVDMAHGLTPLMIVSNHGHINTVNALVQSGADINKTEDALLCTALDIAVECKHEKIVTLLENKKDDLIKEEDIIYISDKDASNKKTKTSYIRAFFQLLHTKKLLDQTINNYFNQKLFNIQSYNMI